MQVNHESSRQYLSKDQKNVAVNFKLRAKLKLKFNNKV